MAIDPGGLYTAISLGRAHIVPIKLCALTRANSAAKFGLVAGGYLNPFFQDANPRGVRQLAHSKPSAQRLDPALASFYIKR